MPLGTLARCLLPLLAAVPSDATNPFAYPPFTLPVFRTNLMLPPTATDEQLQLYEDESLDVDDNDSSGPVDASDGFSFTKREISNLPAAQASAFSDYALIQANRFYRVWIWSEIRRLRALGFSAADGVKHVDLVNPGTVLENGRTDEGWHAYRTLILTLLGRPRGIMQIVKEAMDRHRATPAEQWRDARDENRHKVDGRPMDEYKVPIPSPGPFTSSRTLLDEVAELVFGPEVFNERGVVQNMYRECAKVFANRGWEQKVRSLKRSSKRSQAMCVQMDIYLKAARESGAVGDLEATVEHLKRWRATATKTLEVGDPPFQSMETELAELIQTYGLEKDEEHEGKKQGSIVGVGGRNTKTGSVLPSEADVAAAHEYWNDYCRLLQDEQTCPTPVGPVRPQVPLLVGNNDIGMDEFRGSTIAQLWASLGLPGACRFPFAARGDGVRPAAVPRWHQVVGSKAIVVRAYTAELGQAADPTLLCDDVGLGKTLQIIGAISLIAHTREQQEQQPDRSLPLPPFAIENKTPFFAGLKQIPNRPYLVVALRTTTSQWMDEIRGFTEHGSFHILRYSSDQKSLAKYFSDPKGEYRRAAGPNNEHADRVIVVAEHSAIGREMGRCFKAQKKLGGRAAQRAAARGDPDALVVKDGVNLEGTIFGMKFNLVAYDESHGLRNVSLLSLAATWISSRSLVRVGATATPIFTGPKDIASQARVLQHQPLIGDAGEKLHEAMHLAQGERTKKWGESSSELIAKAVDRDVMEISAAAGACQDTDRMEQIRRQVERKYDSEDQRSILKMSYISDTSIEMLRKLMLPIILRRTGASTDPTGKPVLDLRPYRTVTAWSPLWEKEQEGLDRVNEVQLEQKSLRKRVKMEGEEPLLWSNFLLSQKHSCLHSEIGRLRDKEKEKNLKPGTLTNRIVDDWNEKNLKQKASSRLLKVDEIIGHFWEGNRKPPVYREDGTRDLEAEARQDSPEPLQRPRKFLVYVEYQLHRRLLKKVLDIRGLGLVQYDGSMSKRQREAAITKFEKDDQCRVMLISNVGAAGLNLTIASIVIFLSNVWSGQERKQILGRAWRLGQTAEVIVVDILAPRGIDLALAGYAAGKSVLSATFLRSQRELHRVHTALMAVEHQYDPEESDTEEDDESPASLLAPTRSRVVKRKLKSAPADSTSEPDIEEDEHVAPPPKKKSKSKLAAPRGAAEGPCVNAASQAGFQPPLKLPPPDIEFGCQAPRTSDPDPLPSIPSSSSLSSSKSPLPLASHATQPSELRPTERPRARPRPRKQTSSEGSGPADMFDLSGLERVVPPQVKAQTATPTSRRVEVTHPPLVLESPASAGVTRRGSGLVGESSKARSLLSGGRASKPGSDTGPQTYSDAERQLAVDLGFAPTRQEGTPDSVRVSGKRKDHDTHGQNTGGHASPVDPVGNRSRPVTTQLPAPSAATSSSLSTTGSNASAKHTRVFKKRSTGQAAASVGTSQSNDRKSQLDKNDALIDKPCSGPRSPSRVPRKNLFGGNA